MKLLFEPGFFEEEQRSGFIVSSEMKRDNMLRGRLWRLCDMIAASFS